jgi:hypothetical protein
VQKQSAQGANLWPLMAAIAPPKTVEIAIAFVTAAVPSLVKPMGQADGSAVCTVAIAVFPGALAVGV